jgi:hypothetical protein
MLSSETLGILTQSPAVAQWLERCAKSWNVAGSILGGVIENFH